MYILINKRIFKHGASHLNLRHCMVGPMGWATGSLLFLGKLWLGDMVQNLTHRHHQVFSIFQTTYFSWLS